MTTAQDKQLEIIKKLGEDILSRLDKDITVKLDKIGLNHEESHQTMQKKLGDLVLLMNEKLSLLDTMLEGKQKKPAKKEKAAAPAKKNDEATGNGVNEDDDSDVSVDAKGKKAATETPAPVKVVRKTPKNYFKEKYCASAEFREKFTQPATKTAIEADEGYKKKTKDLDRFKKAADICYQVINKKDSPLNKDWLRIYDAEIRSVPLESSSEEQIKSEPSSP